MEGPAKENEAQTKEKPPIIFQVDKPNFGFEKLKNTIPCFERLNKTSQEFAALVWHLSSQTREEFLAENPSVKEMIRQCAEYNKRLDDGQSNSAIERLINYWKDFFEKHLMDSEWFKDNKIFLVTMRELVQLRILELRDAEDSKVAEAPRMPAYYSHQTNHMSREILERFQDQLVADKKAHGPGMVPAPDRVWGLLLDLRDNPIPDEVERRLQIIHTLISAQHERYRGNEKVAPRGQNFIKDFWKYTALNMTDFSTRNYSLDDSPEGSWNSVALSFFDKLDNLNFTK